MEMSTHIVGFESADNEWNRKKDAWIACEKAGIDIPEELWEFFEDEPPGDKPGKDIDLSSYISEWSDKSRSGFEIRIRDLPANVEYIRFYNEW